MGKIKKTIYLVGAYQLLKPLYCAGMHFYNGEKREADSKLSNKERLLRTYAAGVEKPWALVTGGSEGIGAEFTKELARSGFNVCICSRSMDKLNKVKDLVEKECEGTKIEPVAIDFSKSTDYSGFVSNKEVMSNLRLVVNNVGYFKPKAVFASSGQELQDHLTINLYPITLITKYAK